MAVEQPVFVFAPGAWHGPECFRLVQNKLHAKGYETRRVTYPSVGAEPPNKGLADDAAALRAEIQGLADQGRQVIVVVHSYGGLVGAEATPGLGFKQRKAEGKAGGVTLLVYLSAFVTPKGASILNMLGGKPMDWMDFQVSHSRRRNRLDLLGHLGYCPYTTLADALDRVREYLSKAQRKFSTTMSLPTYRERPWRISSTSLLLCSATKSLTSPGRTWTACTCSVTMTRLSCPRFRRCWRPSWVRPQFRGPARPPIHHFYRSRTTWWKAWYMAPRRFRRGYESIHRGRGRGWQIIFKSE